MPFCTKCGHEAGAGDAFCSNCGASQTPGREAPSAGASGASGSAGPQWCPPPRGKFPHDTNPRVIAALCYFPTLGWISSLYILAGERFRHDPTVRFHAFQGLYLFVGWLVLDWAVGPFVNGWWRIVGLLKAAFAIIGFIMLAKTLRNQDERLPFFGDLADRSMREQR